MEILHIDNDVIVCIKPARVLSTDEPGGLPALLRLELKEPTADIRTVHRLDRVVSGVMVLARSASAASDISRQIREGLFKKEYQAVVHGKPEIIRGTMKDLLYRDKARRMTMVASGTGKDVQEAILEYEVLGACAEMSKVKVILHTGRTHQIRVQFASRGMPLLGERKYSTLEDPCEIALWSYKIGFIHPATKQYMEFTKEPPFGYPWDTV